MTTIEEEMDEFFNFEDAANPPPPQLNDLDLSKDIDLSDFPSGPYDINLAFAEQENDENSFACLQHFSEPWGHLMPDPENGGTIDTAMMGPDDFTDFPRWIDGMDVPTDPCVYCRRMRIHCKVLKEGLRKGSCTSCVALARSCSLTHDPSRQQVNNDRYRCTRSDFCLPGNTIDDDDLCYLPGNAKDDDDLNLSGLPSPALPTPACDYCRSRGYQCKQIQEGGRIGACTSCVALVRHCSLAPQNELGDWSIDDGMNPSNTWIPSKSPLESPDAYSHSRSTPNLICLRTSDENINADLGESGPKAGVRFSKEALRVLRSWVSTHHRHPYPTEEEKESLGRQTGLNKTQITNWLANARRRGKVRAPRSTSPSVRNYSHAMDIPRRATPGIEHMNPLERWKHSPPEHEPASVTAIAKAVTSSTFSSGRESPYSYGHTDDGSGRSLCNVSSTSSLGTSHSSGGSFASAFSHKSRESHGSFGSFGNRGRRRRRRQAQKPVKVPTLNGPIRTFQCTFCTETFKTKHDWQRHEKSLHLSLERWVCCPHGPAQFCADYGHNRCVFCGLPNPPSGHEEVHNYSSCADRSLEERTFYRKDHLRQHLNLVHDVKFQNFSMESWKVATPEIRSRCGFCGIVMDSWTIRVDHLAEHFKGGKSMADWKGDWGFEPQVLDIVENGIPPSSKDSPSATRTLEDLIKIGLVEYLHDCILKGGVPTDDDLLREGRQIIRKADEFATPPGDLEVSWFRDLIMFSGGHSREDENVYQAAAGGIPWAKRRDVANSFVTQAATDVGAIKCSKERALLAFVNAKLALGLTATDSELQIEACRILDETEVTSNHKCKDSLAWFKYLIIASKTWLADFRRRAGLPASSEMAIEHIRPTDDKKIDNSIHTHSRLETELADFVRLKRAEGVTPTDAEIQHFARLTVYNNDDPWNQTAMDDPIILHLFKRQQGLAPENEDGPDMPPLSEAVELGFPQAQSAPSPKTLHWDLQQTGIGLPSPPSVNNNSTGGIAPNIDQPLHTLVQNQPSTNTNPTQPLRYFLNDANCYVRLVRELSRYVTTCMSVNNPARRIPTDAEIQNQARWIIYDDDDPWNQTAADNAEWLIRFKRDVGLAPPEEGPGLPTQSVSWQVKSGGSGFSPPYLKPKDSAEFVDDVDVKMADKHFTIKKATAQKFLRSIASRYQPPAAVFCSRELEQGLNELVQSEVANGMYPSDDALRARAREIEGLEITPADDVHLLEKFKSMHGISTSAQPAMVPLTEAEILAEFDQELAQGNLNLGGTETDMLASVDPTPSLQLTDHTESPTGISKDYAELHRVHAATASPLRRRASEKMAVRSGLPLPMTLQGHIHTNPHEQTATPEDLGEEVFDEQREKGVNEEEIATETNRLFGKYLERKWRAEEGEMMMLASGVVGRLPRSGMMPVKEWDALVGLEDPILNVTDEQLDVSMTISDGKRHFRVRLGVGATALHKHLEELNSESEPLPRKSKYRIWKHKDYAVRDEKYALVTISRGAPDAVLCVIDKIVGEDDGIGLPWPIHKLRYICLASVEQTKLGPSKEGLIPFRFYKKWEWIIS
ncbi:hypothetical protein G7Y89_g12893 [Cudoniella acicularis]|uniref:Uncharacterized protein n=1 Tax=Cudoniella acicularis TaxID=354080 RepID=A0A8H4VWJ4_9HELO|nr:hypothetical protein G7Y89_g12893 [Cudoniella acicularis]